MGLLAPKDTPPVIVERLNREVLAVLEEDDVKRYMANAGIEIVGSKPAEFGAFFRSVDYTQEDTELVIVVTPRLVRPIARGVTLPLPGGRQEVSDSTFNAWGYYLMGPVGGQQMPGFSR